MFPAKNSNADVSRQKFQSRFFPAKNEIMIFPAKNSNSDDPV
jgi:hypothetical protein